MVRLVFLVSVLLGLAPHASAGDRIAETDGHIAGQFICLENEKIEREELDPTLGGLFYGLRSALRRSVFLSISGGAAVFEGGFFSVLGPRDGWRVRANHAGLVMMDRLLLVSDNGERELPTVTLAGDLFEAEESVDFVWQVAVFDSERRGGILDLTERFSDRRQDERSTTFSCLSGAELESGLFR